MAWMYPREGWLSPAAWRTMRCKVRLAGISIEAMQNFSPWRMPWKAR